MATEARAARPLRDVHLYATAWLPVYTACCVAGSVPWLAITLPLGLSVASDAVFGALVALGGPLGDLAFRWAFRRRMLLLGPVEALWVWPAIGLAVALLRPLE